MSDWISVEERRPEIPGTYRVKAKHWCHGSLVGESDPRVAFDGEDFELSIEEEYGEEYREITHWEALPK